MKKEPIVFKGDKKLWAEFTKAVKKEDVTIWYRLSRMIEQYLKKKR